MVYFPECLYGVLGGIAGAATMGYAEDFGFWLRDRLSESLVCKGLLAVEDWGENEK